MLTDDPDLIKRCAERVTERLGLDDAMTAMVNATGIQVRMLGECTQLELVMASSALLYVFAAHLNTSAKGRKLQNEAKRRRLAGVAELLRDVADQIDKVTL